MDELTFLLILAGIGVVLLVAMFTYYKHHKKIHDEIQDFNHHTHAIDDVLLSDHTAPENKTGSSGFDKKEPLFSNQSLIDTDLPNSFSAKQQEHFDIDQVSLTNDSSKNNERLNERELVDGVYINSKRVINNPNVSTQTPATTETSSLTAESSTSTDVPGTALPQAEVKSNSSQQSTQTIKIVYDQVPDGVEELIISHTILAKADYFSGQRLFNVIQSAGLSFGEMNIFHYPGDDNPETFALFSIANIIEPGTFNLEAADTFSTPGISMFMRLPTRTESNKAYDKFIEIAQQITSELGGELCDETRSQLTQQAISYKKEQIRKLNFNMAKAEKLAGTN